MKTQPKQLLWLGDSLEALKAFSDEARRSAGHQLGLVQWGLIRWIGSRWKTLAPG